MNFRASPHDIWIERGPLVEIEAMYRCHGPALLRYLQRNFGLCASAEDLLQETFLHAIRSGRECERAQSPRAFLFGIARHVGLTAARRAKLERTIIAQRKVETAAKPDAALDEMRAAIEHLPPQIREALDLRLRDQLSYEEIAAVLAIPVGTVRSRLHTALLRLREELKSGGRA
jgi:RNA polymerase sigma-70 factor (ECF subfamily)